jgi:hypothetical protein
MLAKEPYNHSFDFSLFLILAQFLFLCLKNIIVYQMISFLRDEKNLVGVRMCI